MLKSKAVVLAKIETTYGTDSTPAPETNAILCAVPEFEVIGKKLDRNNVAPYYGVLPPVAIGTGLKLKFKTELKASGVLGTAPEIGVLFRACDFTETVTASTKVVYDPNSKDTDAESITIYFYQHNILHKLLGARGTFSLTAKATEYASIDWEFTGIYGGPADSTIPAAPTFNSQVPQKFVSATFTLDSYAGVIENLKIDVKNDIAQRVDANHAAGIREFFIKNRNVAGECDPEMVTIATKDFWTMWSGSSRVALSATIGAVAGNKIVITAPKVQPDVPKYGERDNLLTMAMPLIFTPNAGNDEVKYTFQ